jgi:hypothetical protein
MQRSFIALFVLTALFATGLQRPISAKAPTPKLEPIAT